jgi:quinol monooxygenase YgiN
MEDNHVILNVHIEAVPGHEESLAGQLLALVAPTRKETGCLVYELHRDPQNPGKFMFYERFASQAALDEHLASPYFKSFVAYRAAGTPDPVASIIITTWRAIA